MTNIDIRKKDEFAGIITQVEDDRYIIFLLNSNTAVKISSIVGIPLMKNIYVVGIVDAIDTQYYLENPDLFFVSKAANNSLEKISESSFRPRFGQEARAKILGYYQFSGATTLVPVPDTSNRYTPKPLERVFLFPANWVSSILGLAPSSQDCNSNPPSVFSLGRICYPFEKYDAIFYQSVFNKHTLVAGTTGAGKSRMVALIIKNILINNGHVTIVDPHNEYTNLLYSHQKKYCMNIVSRVLGLVVENLKRQKIVNWKNKVAVLLGKKTIFDVKNNKLIDIEGNDFALKRINLQILHLKEKSRKLGDRLILKKQDFDTVALDKSTSYQESEIKDIGDELEKISAEIVDLEFRKAELQEQLGQIKEYEMNGKIYDLEKEIGIKVEPLQFTAQDLSGAALSLLLPQISIQQEERIREIIEKLQNGGKKVTIENLITEIEQQMQKAGYKEEKKNGKVSIWHVYDALRRKLKEAEKRRLLINDKPDWMNLHTNHVDIFVGDYNDTDDFGKRYITTIIQQFLHFGQDKKKFLIIDEAHQLFSLQDHNTRRLVCQLLRESRKFNTAILMITQNKKDIPEEIIGQFQNVFRFRELGDEDTGNLSDRMCSVSLYGARTNFIMRVDNCLAFYS